MADCKADSYRMSPSYLTNSLGNAGKLNCIHFLFSGSGLLYGLIFDNSLSVSVTGYLLVTTDTVWSPHPMCRVGGVTETETHSGAGAGAG